MNAQLTIALALLAFGLGMLIYNSPWAIRKRIAYLRRLRRELVAHIATDTGSTFRAVKRLNQVDRELDKLLGL